MKILARMEDMPMETISGDSKFVLNGGQEGNDDAGGIPVPSMHLSLDHHRVGYSSSSAADNVNVSYNQQLYRDRLGVLRQSHFQSESSSVPHEHQYSSSSARYNDDDEESVKTEITEETDVEEGEEDQIIPGLVINTNPTTDAKDDNEDAPTSIESGAFSNISGRDSGGDPEHEQQRKQYEGSSPVLNEEETASKLENIRSPDNWSEAVQEEASSATPGTGSAERGIDSDERGEKITTIKSPLRVQASRSPRRLYLNPRQRLSPSRSPVGEHKQDSAQSDVRDPKEEDVAPPPPPPLPQEKPKTKKVKVNKPAEVPKRTSRQRTKLQRYNPDEEAAKPQLLQSYGKKDPVQLARPAKSGKEKKRAQDKFVAYDSTYDLKVDTRVRARWSSGNRVYKAVITGVNEDGTYRLLYNDGGRWDSVPRRRIVEFAEGNGSTEGSSAKPARASKSKKQRGRSLKKKKRNRRTDVSLDPESLPGLSKAKRGRRSSGHAKRVHHEFRGLTWSQQKRKWIARIYHKNTTLHLGTFTSPEEAARMYDSAARPLGKKLNFPTDEDLRNRHKRMKIAAETDDIAALLNATPKKKPTKKRKIKKKKNKSRGKRKRMESAAEGGEDYEAKRGVEPEEEVDRRGEEGVEQNEEAEKKEKAPDMVANFVDKQQEQYNLVGVFTARKRKKRRLYDPTVEAEKPQWLSKDERPTKVVAQSRTSSIRKLGTQKKGKATKLPASRISEPSSSGGMRHKQKKVK